MAKEKKNGGEENKALEKFFGTTDLDAQKVIEEARQAALDEREEVLADIPPQHINTKNMEEIVGKPSMEGIILFHSPARAFYKSPKPQEGQRPDCASPNCKVGYGDNTEGEGQHDCLTCPMAQWGTAKGGTEKGQACRKMRLMVFFRTSPRDARTPLTEIVRVAPTGLKRAAKYLEELIASDKNYFTVKTRITVVDGAMGHLEFEYIEDVPESAHAGLAEASIKQRKQFADMVRKLDAMSGTDDDDDADDAKPQKAKVVN